MKQLLLAIFAVSLASALQAAESLAPKADGTPLRLACVGDSITQGVGAGNGMAYPTQLQALLGKGWEVGNFGVSGRTLLRKGDNPYWKEAAYAKALEFKPDAVIIMLGTNDTKPQNWKFKDEFEADYKMLIKSFQGVESKPRIYICRACPVIGDGSYGIKEDGIQEQIPIVNKIAAELGLGIIDMHATLKDTPDLIPDNVHPNAEGGRKMAAAAAAVLTGKK